MNNALVDNQVIADQLDLLAKLMDIHGDDPIKAKIYSSASFTIEKLPGQLSSLPKEKWATIRGIGKSISAHVEEIIQNGELSLLKDYISKTPLGVIEMLKIKGIGPKKIHTIWKEMNIESIGELLYACQENRLLLFKGFGAKTQENVKASIEFYLQHQGHFLYAEMMAIFPAIETYLINSFGKDNVAVTGNYRRQLPTLEELAFVISLPKEKIKKAFDTAQPPQILEESEASIVYELKNGIKLRLYINGTAQTLFETSAGEEFLLAFKNAYPTAVTTDQLKDEKNIFKKAGLPFVYPCLRETEGNLNKAIENKLPELIQYEDICGLIHCHSNWSDGSNPIEDMAATCQEKGWSYMLISDHSQTAFYANGLKANRVQEQHKQIEQLNKSTQGFKIFKGIESDILNDGELDYPSEILQTFDLIIASVHSNLSMPQEKANQRLLKAIENPFTSILGHPTGRLLLSRNGYPINHQLIIDACAANNVAIEINAHPRRLDLDWKWIEYALEKGVMLSINPDAHALDGIDDVKYGVLAAQKGGLTASNNLSSKSLSEFESFIKGQHQKRP
jgi:DNA polymerase (family 10)